MSQSLRSQPKLAVLSYDTTVLNCSRPCKLLKSGDKLRQHTRSVCIGSGRALPALSLRVHCAGSR